MRILQVVPTYLPARRYGGPIVAVHGLCKALAARGHEVTVFTTNVDGAGTTDVPLGQPVAMDGVRIVYFPSPLPRLYWSPSMARALAAAVGQYDVIHVHSVYLWPTAAAAGAARRAKKPYVISPRGMLVRELIRRKNRIVKSAWLALIERRNFRGAAAIHFTSQLEWEDARELALPLPSPLVIPNGIELPPEHELQRDDDLVLFLGRVHWKKGLDRLVAAMDLLPAARLVIAGNDEENYAVTLPKQERITFAGEVQGQVKDELLRRAAVLVLPSLSENFGNVVIEAMAVGTPVIVTEGVGLASDVGEADAGLVSEPDPASLAGAIRSLLSDPQRRKAMGARGRALVESRFTWARVAAQMEEAYCSLTSRR